MWVVKTALTDGTKGSVASPRLQRWSRALPPDFLTTVMAAKPDLNLKMVAWNAYDAQKPEDALEAVYDQRSRTLKRRETGTGRAIKRNGGRPLGQGLLSKLSRAPRARVPQEKTCFALSRG